MKLRRVMIVAGAGLLLVVAWLAWRQGGTAVRSAAIVTQIPASPTATPEGETAPPAVYLPAQPHAAMVAPPAAAAAAPAQFIMATPAAPAAANPATAGGSISTAQAMAELEKVHHMIDSYHTLMGQNPVGTNAEIMQALMGGNPHQAMLGPPPGQSLNSKGELLDPWGTPYFFHQLSGDDMEIHSAGPDKVMGTRDDLDIP